MWLQLDTDLLDQPRWLSCSLPARLWYVAMLAECLKAESGMLDIAEWMSNKMMRGKLALDLDEYPDLTAQELLAELSGPATHLIDVDDTSIVVHGFQARYGPTIEKRRADAERKRAGRRKKSSGRPPDVPRTGNGRPTGRPPDGARSPRVDLDLDLDVHQDIDSPPSQLTENVSVAGTGLTTEPQAGNEHSAPQTHDKPDFTSKAPMSEATAMRLADWLESDSYRKPAALRELVAARDRTDPVTVLAHMLEIEKVKDATSRCALLWIRLMPGKDGPILPAEWAIGEAKQLLEGPDDSPRGGAPSSPGDALKGLVASRKANTAGVDYLGIFNGLTAGWSGPNDNDHHSEKAVAYAMVDADPMKAIALVYEINELELFKGTEPWGKISQMCEDLSVPGEKFRSEAVNRIEQSRKEGA